MVSWSEFERAEPAFAERVQRILDAHRHKTIATLRVDGSPRISGIEAEIDAGELTFGSMPGSRKGADLRREPRFALHSGGSSEQDIAASGDAKVAGRAVLAGALPEGGPQGDGFRANLEEVVITGLNESATMLRIETWRPDTGVRVIERS